MHTYIIHTYIHTYVHACIHTYILTYLEQLKTGMTGLDKGGQGPTSACCATEAEDYILQTHNNTREHERGYALELYSLAEVQQFRTAIFEAPNNDHIGRNM
jgi:hypothetical protein